MSCTAPSMLLTGKCVWAKFPEMWPKLSTQNKTKRMLREIKQECGASFLAGRHAYLHEYVPLIFRLIIKHLTSNKEDVLQAIDIMKQQGLTVETFKEHVLTLLLDTSGTLYNELDPKIKTMFTKCYTQMCPTSLKRVKQQKQAGGDKVLDYKEGFDPNYEEDCDDVSEESETEQKDNVVDGFEVVGKSKEVKKGAAQKVQRKTKEPDEDKTTNGSRGRGRGSARGRGGNLLK